MPTADIIGYGLHPHRFPGVITVCHTCLDPQACQRFEDAYDSDALGEIMPWTVDDDDPVLCDVCSAQIHPGRVGTRRDDEELCELQHLAVQLGIVDAELDESVIDLCNKEASDCYNNGADVEVAAGEDDSEAFERLHDEADRRASAINNGGTNTQLGYLCEALGRDGTRDLLHEIAEQRDEAPVVRDARDGSQDFTMPNGMVMSVRRRGCTGSDGWQEWSLQLAQRAGGPVLATEGIRIPRDRSARCAAQTFAAIFRDIGRGRSAAPHDRPWLTPGVVEAFGNLRDRLEATGREEQPPPRA